MDYKISYPVYLSTGFRNITYLHSLTLGNVQKNLRWVLNSIETPQNLVIPFFTWLLDISTQHHILGDGKKFSGIGFTFYQFPMDYIAELLIHPSEVVQDHYFIHLQIRPSEAMKNADPVRANSSWGLGYHNKRSPNRLFRKDTAVYYKMYELLPAFHELVDFYCFSGLIPASFDMAKLDKVKSLFKKAVERLA